MKLPADTLIPSEKITDYFLRSRPENDKSAFLAQAGYTPENAECLERDIRVQLLPLEAETLGPFEYGVNYRIRGTLRGPNGRELRVVSIWAIIEASGLSKLVTLYPHKP